MGSKNYSKVELDEIFELYSSNSDRPSREKIIELCKKYNRKPKAIYQKYMKIKHSHELREVEHIRSMTSAGAIVKLTDGTEIILFTQNFKINNVLITQKLIPEE